MEDPYILEVVVTEEGAAFYPPVGTIETRTDENAGFDVKVVRTIVPTKTAVLAPLGLRARLVKRGKYYTGYTNGVAEFHYTLEPRSSIFKYGCIMANNRGIIDKSYRGELKAPIVSLGTSDVCIEAGTRLFQILAPDLGYIKEVHYVSSLPDTSRGEGGFGSTGTK
jgi:dUTPase